MLVQAALEVPNTIAAEHEAPSATPEDVQLAPAGPIPAIAAILQAGGAPSPELGPSTAQAAAVQEQPRTAAVAAAAAAGAATRRTCCNKVPGGEALCTAGGIWAFCPGCGFMIGPPIEMVDPESTTQVALPSKHSPSQPCSHAQLQITSLCDRCHHASTGFPAPFSKRTQQQQQPLPSPR